MQDKIFRLLQEKAGKNSSVNARTLDKYAKIIAGKITDESQIESEIEPYYELIDDINGNINSVAKKAVKDKELELQPKPKATDPLSQPNDDEKPLTAKEIRDILEAQETKQKHTRLFEQRLTEARSGLLGKGLKPKLVSELLEKVKPDDERPLEALISDIQKKYDEIYSDVMPEAGRPSMSTLPNGDTVPSSIADWAAQKKEEIAKSNEKKDLV